MSDIILNDLNRQNAVALMQPTFMPWQGYFGLMADADKFVLLDDFQFVRRSFHHRNKIFISKNEAGYISLPVTHNGNQSLGLNEVQRQNDIKWNKKFLKSLQHNYGSTSYFNEYYGFTEEWLSKEFESLAEFNIYFIKKIAIDLDIKTEIILSSTLCVSGSRSQRLVKILEELDVDLYLSALGSFDYMKEDNIFPQKEISYIFQNYQPAQYQQTNSETFMSHLSVIDCLFQHGPKETRNIIDKARGIYYSVEELERQKNG